MYLKKEGQIISLYLIIGILWVVFSDKILIEIYKSQRLAYQIQIYKGCLYVLLTAILFYIIIHRSMEKIRKNQKEIEYKKSELEKLNKALEKSIVELNDFQTEIIESLMQMLELHDHYTNGHSESVAVLAKKIAKNMKLPDEVVEQVYWAGIVHDIGKILIPKTVLNKPGRLSDEEYMLIKNHPYWGFQTLKKSERLKKIAIYILYHHERWDGKGYPEGIEKNDIPLVSQILGLADAWDAMTSDRSYRKALSKEDALNEIIRNRGKQFSQQAVDSFLEIVDMYI